MHGKEMPLCSPPALLFISLEEIVNSGGWNVTDMESQWCYVGKRNLDRAIALYMKTYPSARTADTFTIRYRPYYLNYYTQNDTESTTKDGSAPSVPKTEIAEIKLAGMSEEQRAALRKKMDGIGRSAGIQFRHGGMIGRSRDAHRLVHVASAKQIQEDGGESVTDTLVEFIMRAFHEEEKDITDRTLLRELATTAGMTNDQIEEALQSEEVGRMVDEEAEKYRALIQGAGVPTYLINGGQRIDGSQDPADWFELFVKVKEGGETAVSQGTQCS